MYSEMQPDKKVTAQQKKYFFRHPSKFNNDSETTEWKIKLNCWKKQIYLRNQFDSVFWQLAEFELAD